MHVASLAHMYNMKINLIAIIRFNNSDSTVMPVLAIAFNGVTGGVAILYLRLL